jgi:hypothetical protein
MKHTLAEQYSIGELVEQFRRNALLVNPDYQRGAVWTTVALNARPCMMSAVRNRLSSRCGNASGAVLRRQKERGQERVPRVAGPGWPNACGQ